MDGARSSLHWDDRFSQGRTSPPLSGVGVYSQTWLKYTEKNSIKPPFSMSTITTISVI